MFASQNHSHSSMLSGACAFTDTADAEISMGAPTDTATISSSTHKASITNRDLEAIRDELAALDTMLAEMEEVMSLLATWVNSAQAAPTSPTVFEDRERFQN